jgi:hypothetical protein
LSGILSSQLSAISFQLENIVRTNTPMGCTELIRDFGMAKYTQTAKEDSAIGLLPAVSG